MLTDDELAAKYPDLLAAYPGAFKAVLLHEFQEPMPRLFAVMRRCAISPADAHKKLCKAVDNSTAAFPDPVMDEIRRQMDHPDFLKFIMAKLGAV